jgi:hypothetical protein
LQGVFDILIDIKIRILVKLAKILVEFSVIFFSFFAFLVKFLLVADDPFRLNGVELLLFSFQSKLSKDSKYLIFLSGDDY